MSSAMISSGRPDWTTASRTGSMAGGPTASFRTAGCRQSSSTDFHLVGVGDEVGREVAAVELHAFDDVQLGLGGLGFFNRDDAFVADLFHGLGDHVADFVVAVGGDGADLGDLVCWSSETFLARFLMSATTELRRPCRCRASGPSGSCRRRPTCRPSLHDGLRARTVAVVVPSPALSLVLLATSRIIWAPMFSNCDRLSSISLATVTPSLVERGAPKDFSRSRRCGPWGPGSPSRRWRGC